VNLWYFTRGGGERAATTQLGFSSCDFDAARRRGVDTFMVDHRGYLHHATFAEGFHDASVIATGLPACPIWLEDAGLRDTRDMDYFHATGRR